MQIRDRTRQICERYLSGESAASIARSLDTHTTSITTLLKRQGIVLRERSKFRLSEEDELAVVEAYRTLESPKLIAKRFGCTDATIRNIVRRHPGTVRRRGGFSGGVDQARIDEIVSRWRNGEKLTAIGRNMGMSYISVEAILRANGLEDEVAEHRSHGPGWKGGIIVGQGGYRHIFVDRNDPMHVMANKENYVPEHRLVMARSLGRPLGAYETVHHINGDTSDNRLENLQLRHGQHGAGQAVHCNACSSYNIVSTCADCGSHDIGFGRISERRASYAAG